MTNGVGLLTFLSHKVKNLLALSRCFYFIFVYMTRLTPAEKFGSFIVDTVLHKNHSFLHNMANFAQDKRMSM